MNERWSRKDVLVDSPAPVSDVVGFLDDLWQSLPGNATAGLDHTVEVVWTALVSRRSQVGQAARDVPALVVLDWVADADPESGEGCAGTVDGSTAVEQLGSCRGGQHFDVDAWVLLMKKRN